LILTASHASPWNRVRRQKYYEAVYKFHLQTQRILSLVTAVPPYLTKRYKPGFTR
jgi:hypothetical protein